MSIKNKLNKFSVKKASLIKFLPLIVLLAILLLGIQVGIADPNFPPPPPPGH